MSQNINFQENIPSDFTKFDEITGGWRSQFDSFISNKVPDFAFQERDGLSSVILPDTVTEIGQYAFSMCCGLISVFIPASVVEIGESAFSGCPDLKSVTVHPGNPAYTSENGVLFNRDKTELIQYPAGFACDYAVPASVVKIGMYAFYECAGLTSVIFPNSVAEIDYNAFRGCTALTSTDIPASVIDIGSHAFSDCAGMTSIAAHPDNPVYASESGVLFNKDKTALLAYPQARRGDYVIPLSVTKIEEYAFENCAGLTSVLIPASVKEIGSYAFKGCTGLTSVVIPDSVTKIRRNTFEGCSGLATVTIPDSVVEIRSGAFSGCTGLSSLFIPASVIEIGKSDMFDKFSAKFDLSGFDFHQATKSWGTFFTVHPDNPVYMSENRGLEKK